MRIIMMGTGPFAVPTFQALVESPHDVAVLVTRPLPKVRTRGKPPRNPMREAAEDCGVSVLSPDDINQDTAIKQLVSLRPDLLVVCDYGQILSSTTLDVAPLGGINLHGSLLPRYRGAAPVQWAILNGDSETGVSVIHMTPRLDAGPCLVQSTTPIRREENAEQLEQRLSVLGVEAVEEAIEILDKWDRRSEIGSRQDAKLATKAPRLRKQDGEVDWTNSAQQIYNQVRGLKPWPGTYTSVVRDGTALRLILDCVAVGDGNAPDAPGTVVSVSSDSLSVSTGSGILVLKAVQPAGKRVMPIGDFLRGHPLRVGNQLS